jgi:hypothetical protein
MVPGPVPLPRQREDAQMSDAEHRSEPEDLATQFACKGAQRSLQVGQVVTGRILQATGFGMTLGKALRPSRRK